MPASTSKTPGCLPGSADGRSPRSALKTAGPFPFTEEWKSLVATLENGLRLHRHEPGTLTAQAQHLHCRTGGSISSLSHLIRQAAIMAILTGTEKIDRELLNETSIDHAAESLAPQQRLKTRRRTSPTRATLTDADPTGMPVALRSR
jgi:hypothetical protein